jgi:hypothetical protein
MVMTLTQLRAELLERRPNPVTVDALLANYVVDAARVEEYKQHRVELCPRLGNLGLLMVHSPGQATRAERRGDGMITLELCYHTKLGAGVVRYLRDVESTDKALKSLMRRHIEADLYVQGERDEQGNRLPRIGGVDEIDGKWNYAYDPSVFKEVEA